jgi:5S rRNA maturation endonuclease (ribonuclease M5)
MSWYELGKDEDESLRGKGLLWKNKDIAMRKTRRLRNNERTLIDLIQSLDEQYEKLFVIVEGKRDEKVLRDLGLKAPIIKTQSGIPRVQFLRQLVEEIGDGQVLILTDFDDEGKEICSHIERELEIKRVRVLRRLRREIRKAMGNWRCIEELVALFRRKDSPEPAV